MKSSPARPCWLWLAGAAVSLALLGPQAAHAGCDPSHLSHPSATRSIFRLDGAASSVQFDAKAFLHDFSGKTSKIQGAIGLAEPDQPTAAAACIRIDAASLDTGNATRDATMRNEHLETDKFPEIFFELTQVEHPRRVADVWEFEASGTLTLHGVARPIVIPIQARPAGNAMQISGQVPLKMSDYGIRQPKLLFVTVDDQVLVRFDVTAARVP